MDLFLAPLPEISLTGVRTPEYSVYERPPIQESESLPGANLNTANFEYEKFEEDRGDLVGGEQENRQQVFTPANNSFAAILEIAGNGEVLVEGARTNGVANFAAKAAEAYETNARVIAGDNNPLGGSLSLTL